MAYHQVRDLRNRLSSGPAPSARSPRIAAAGPSLAAIPTKRVDFGNAQAAQAADLVDILQQKLASQHSELESRTDSINQIQRNFEKLHERLLFETSSHANLQAQVKSLQLEKEECEGRNGQLVAEVADLQARLAVAEGNHTSSLRAITLAEESANAAIRATSDELSRAEQAEERCAALQTQLQLMKTRAEDAETRCAAAAAAQEEALSECKTFAAIASDLQSQARGMRCNFVVMGGDGVLSGEPLLKFRETVRGCISVPVEALESLSAEVGDAASSLRQVTAEFDTLRGYVSTSVDAVLSAAVPQAKCALWNEVVCAFVRRGWSEKEALLEQSRAMSLEGEVRSLRSQAAAFVGGMENAVESERVHRAALAARDAEIEALRSAAIGSAAASTRYQAELAALRDERTRLEERCNELLRVELTRVQEVSMLERMLEERQTATAEAQGTLDDLQQQLTASRDECERLTELLQAANVDLDKSWSMYGAIADEVASLRQRAVDAERRMEAAVHDHQSTARDVARVEAEASSLRQKEVELKTEVELLASRLGEREHALQRAFADADAASLSAHAAQRDFRSQLDALLEQRRTIERLFSDLDGVVSKLQHADGTIETAVTCLSCMRVLTCAKTLPCGHAACTACIAKGNSICGDCGGAANPSVPAVGLDVVAANFNYRRQAMRGLLTLVERLKAQLEDAQAPPPSAPA